VQPANKGRVSVISFKIDIMTLRRIDNIVRLGYFKSKSDLIRVALRSKLAKDGYLVQIQ